MSEFDDVIATLRAERPEADALELDAIKQRARRRAANPSRRKQSMKTRLAIIATLAVGMIFSTAGAGLAISGLAGSGNASTAQYPVPPQPPAPQPVAPAPAPPQGQQPSQTSSPDEGGVEGETDTNAPSGSNDTAPSGDVKGETQAQPAAQVEAGASGSSLPFTGFAAIPVILVGGVLLTAGMVLRRRSTDE